MPVTDSPLFLGFTTVEGLCAELSEPAPDVTDLTVYVTTLSTTSYIPNSSMGTASDTLVVQGILPSRVIGYCRIRMGSFSIVNGTPLDPKEAKAGIRRVASAKRLVLAWLNARGFRTVEATFATVRDLVLLDGSADFMHYDKETDTFVGATELGDR